MGPSKGSSFRAWLKLFAWLSVTNLPILKVLAGVFKYQLKFLIQELYYKELNNEAAAKGVKS
jgi:hypothetical protein